MPRQARREYTIAERAAYVARKTEQYNQRGYLPSWVIEETRAIARHIIATPTMPENSHLALVRMRQAGLRIERENDSPSRSPSPPPRPTPASTPAIPDHIINQLRELAIAANKKYECPICMEDIPAADAQMTNCGHHYCAPCLSQLKAAARHERQWTCAVCRSKHSH